MPEFYAVEIGATFTSTIHHDTYPAIDPSTHNAKNHPASSYPRSVLITAAAKGIGRATAIAYAQSGLVARIAITARRLSQAESVCADIIAAALRAGRAEAPQTLALEMDVCDRASIDAVAARIKKEWRGRLDILINNAAYLASFAPLGDSDEAEWWYTWEVNVRGTYWVTKALLPLLLSLPQVQEEDGDGSNNSNRPGDKTIINVSSIGALAIPPGASAYNTSKTAVTRLTEFLMVDYAGSGLLSYSIHPASVSTDLGRRMPGWISDSEAFLFFFPFFRFFSLFLPFFPPFFSICRNKTQRPKKHKTVRKKPN